MSIEVDYLNLDHLKHPMSGRTNRQVKSTRTATGTIFSAGSKCLEEQLRGGAPK